MPRAAALLLVAATAAAAEPPPRTRELERINWMEFREWVPARVRTVLLPLGTLEAHGVAASGADILAPVAIARENWWSYCSDVTLEVFGEDGGHAGENETAFVQAIDPTSVLTERYRREMATTYPAPNTWSAYPFPSTIGLYKEGQGHPTFDAAKAKAYYAKVNDKVGRLVEDTIRKWDLARIFEER